MKTKSTNSDKILEVKPLTIVGDHRIVFQVALIDKLTSEERVCPKLFQRKQDIQTLVSFLRDNKCLFVDEDTEYKHHSI